MTTSEAAWEEQISALWADMDNHEEDEFFAKVKTLADELPAGDARALFELACANDSTGHSDRAAPLYRKALATGLTGERRRRAVIQLASSLRNLGQAEESVELLRAEREAGSDGLDDAVAGFLALALADTGQEREALSLALTALSRHLPRYNRSLSNYAGDLAGEPAAESA
ncbi:tetratricopeptide repeat protein [Streptomyces sp. NPDC051322]|uniref:tetratricopeptide repeat protein n=1 Tax=Streptomyces sp. NPDC051322 TaxID=3154645 RepID=UPI00344FBFE2